MTTAMEHGVGPILSTGEVAEAILAAIHQANHPVFVQHRGSYMRVRVDKLCVLRRADVERALGRSFRFPGDLECCMPSFTGVLKLSDEEATWASVKQ